MALQLQVSVSPVAVAVGFLRSQHGAGRGGARSSRPDHRYAYALDLQSAQQLPLPLPQQSRPRLKPPTQLKVLARVASKGTYICRDCGYIYKDRTPFEKLPDKYFCPVCGAPKRRFRPYEPKVTKDANDTSVRKARKEQLKRDEAIGNALPFAVVLGVAALVALYFYLNTAY